MYHFYVNKNAQSNGDHEVHRDGCTHMPNTYNAQYLGIFANCREAVAESKRKYYAQSDGCFYCCPDAHKR